MPRVGSSSIKELSQPVNEEMRKSIPPKPQKQKSDSQAKIMKKISKSMKDDLRKKAAEIKEL